VLKRDRFSLILKFLHLNDNSSYIPKGQPGHDPLYKLRPLLDPLIANFQASYTLHRELSIDEAMVGFKGRLFFIQDLPKKPTKWGMKAYVLADSCMGYYTIGGCTQVSHEYKTITRYIVIAIHHLGRIFESGRPQPHACNCCGIVERHGGQRSPCIHGQLLQ
jgi:hypothetical protein